MERRRRWGAERAEAWSVSETKAKERRATGGGEMQRGLTVNRGSGRCVARGGARGSVEEGRGRRGLERKGASSCGRSNRSNWGSTKVGVVRAQQEEEEDTIVKTKGLEYGLFKVGVVRVLSTLSSPRERGKLLWWCFWVRPRLTTLRGRARFSPVLSLSADADGQDQERWQEEGGCEEFAHQVRSSVPRDVDILCHRVLRLVLLFGFHRGGHNRSAGEDWTQPKLHEREGGKVRHRLRRPQGCVSNQVPANGGPHACCGSTHGEGRQIG
mmetsp:Transcript_12415/g.34532  ORF Transcript_12415/g.34532 Transcript_12415/m.34532 type:complete len:269 (+) Transcript_12415:22-828(+)